MIFFIFFKLIISTYVRQLKKIGFVFLFYLQKKINSIKYSMNLQKEFEKNFEKNF